MVYKLSVHCLPMVYLCSIYGPSIVYILYWQNNVKLANRQGAFQSGFCSCSSFTFFYHYSILSINGPSMVYQWSIYGLYMVYILSIYGQSMVYQWLINGLYMVYTWSIHGLSLVNLCLWSIYCPSIVYGHNIVHLWSIFGPSMVYLCSLNFPSRVYLWSIKCWSISFVYLLSIDYVSIVYPLTIAYQLSIYCPWSQINRLLVLFKNTLCHYFIM